MVIDMHVHPGFYEKISEDKNEIDFRKKAMGWDLMSTFPVDLTRVQMKFAGVDKLVLLPLDLTTQMKGWVVTNEEVRKMMDLAPDLFYGFASVDPHRPDALEVLDRFIHNLAIGLSNIIFFMNSEMIILNSHLILSLPYLLPEIMKDIVLPITHTQEILLSTLGSDAPILGASMQAIEAFFEVLSMHG